jgi:hypothetical protein
MRMWRVGRIDLSEADRLAAGGAPGPEHPGLGAVLRAVTAAPSRREMAGEQAAVAGFVAARRPAVPVATSKGGRRLRVSLPARMAAVKVAVGVAVVTIGGTATAAETGSLQDSVQRHVHHLFSPLGVPAPSTPGRPPGTDHGGAGGSGGPSVSSAGPTPGIIGPSGTAVRGLCEAWDAARADPRGKATTAEALRVLAVAAGSDSAIPAFCTALLSDNGGRATFPATPSHGPDRVVPTPSHPGGAINEHPHPTPSPHH